MGSYVNKNLIHNEHVVYEAYNHWIILFSFSFISYFFKTNEYVLTNKRILIKEGLISRRTVEINLSKSESINVDQSILGRLLGYGSLTVIGTGGTRETCAHISNPLAFRRAFQEIIS